MSLWVPPGHAVAQGVCKRCGRHYYWHANFDGDEHRERALAARRLFVDYAHQDICRDCVPEHHRREIDAGQGSSVLKPGEQGGPRKVYGPGTWR